jgi:phosphinothricin acetyltransferase
MATKDDAREILAIYAPYVKDTAITFDLEAPSEADFTRGMERVREIFPYLVAEDHGKIAGYAYAHPERERLAYQWNAELSVYVSRDYQRQGLGLRLYTALVELLGLLGYRNLYAVITLPNERSMALHRRMGFTHLAVHKNAGYKLGRWHDVIWLEKKLGPYRPDPAPPTPMNELAPDLLRRVLENA